MSIGNIEERIKKMKEAIKTEANQRAQNILERAMDEADIQRNKIVRQERERIEHEYHLKMKAESVRAKIEKSSVVNKERLNKMKHRHELVEKLRGEVRAAIQEAIKDDNRYRKLLEDLMVQSMLRLMERNLYVKARSDQETVVKSAMKNAENTFTSILKESGKDLQSGLELSEYRLEDTSRNMLGGIFMTSNDGKIVCDNTLDSRINLVFELMLPEIRKTLFHKG